MDFYLNFVYICRFDLVECHRFHVIIWNCFRVMLITWSKGCHQSEYCLHIPLPQWLDCRELGNFMGLFHCCKSHKIGVWKNHYAWPTPSYAWWMSSAHLPSIMPLCIIGHFLVQSRPNMVLIVHLVSFQPCPLPSYRSLQPYVILKFWRIS